MAKARRRIASRRKQKESGAAFGSRQTRSYSFRFWFPAICILVLVQQLLFPSSLSVYVVAPTKWEEIYSTSATRNTPTTTHNDEAERRQKAITANNNDRAAFMVVMIVNPRDEEQREWSDLPSLCVALFTFAKRQEPSNLDMIILHNVESGPPVCFEGSDAFFQHRGVYFHYLSVSDFESRLDKVANVSTAAWSNDRYKRKICDTKPTWGLLFPDYLKDYAWWGHVDLDGLFGTSTHLFKSQVLNKFDILSGYCRYAALLPETFKVTMTTMTNNSSTEATTALVEERRVLGTGERHWSTGPMTLFANTPRVSNTIARWLPKWQPLLNEEKCHVLDEWLNRKHGMEPMLHAEKGTLRQLCALKDDELDQLYGRTADYYLLNLERDLSWPPLTIEWSATSGIRINQDGLQQQQQHGKNNGNVFFLHWLEFKIKFRYHVKKCLTAILQDLTPDLDRFAFRFVNGVCTASIH